LIDDAASAGGFTDGTSANIIGHPALLGSTGIYGSANGTQTIPLLSGSPAIDAGDDTTCAAPGAGNVNSLDQRGIARPQGTHCDIGAFEYSSPTTLPGAKMPGGSSGPPSPIPGTRPTGQTGGPLPNSLPPSRP
jgi:hypothetical protein